MNVTNVPAWNAKRPEVPVDKDGDWMSYPWHADHWEVIDYPFYAELVIDHMETGRSSRLAILKDITSGRKYPMFISDLVYGVQHGTFRLEQRVDGGRLIGHWTACKRGKNYGIKAVQM